MAEKQNEEEQHLLTQSIADHFDGGRVPLHQIGPFKHIAFKRFAEGDSDYLERYVSEGGDLGDLNDEQRELLVRAIKGDRPEKHVPDGRPVSPQVQRRNENVRMVMAYMEGGGIPPTNLDTRALVGSWISKSESTVETIWKLRDPEDTFLLWLATEQFERPKDKELLVVQAKEWFDELEKKRKSEKG